MRAPTSNKYKCTYFAMRTESSFRWQFNGASAPVTPHKRQKRTCTERRWGKRVHGSIRTLERRGRDTHGEQTDAWIRTTDWTPATWQFRWPRRYSLTVTPRASILDSAYLLAFPFTYLLTYLLTRREHTRYTTFAGVYPWISAISTWSRPYRDNARRRWLLFESARAGESHWAAA